MQVIILKIQNGFHLKCILVVTTGSFIPKKSGLDTKVVVLCRLKTKLEGKMGILAAIYNHIKFNK